MWFILNFDLLRNSRLTVPMYADRRELLVFRTFSTVSQRVEKVFRHAERTGCKGIAPCPQSVKEPVLSLGEGAGSYVFWGKYKPYCGEKGVVPTPICQLFQIHGSIFKPDPSCDCGQASVVCISHRVLFFCICKDTLNRLFALCINIFCTLCHLVQDLTRLSRYKKVLNLFIRF